ncbi:hypothetical protein V6N12_050471 [Hibiscus sabdariffa]|uniref:CCHC-type domain-containing protein n=1 Tax=Hibiscus sabdariffa TaxID=183260 RepID=A0ABR2GCM7_9ROSI
MDRNSKKPRRRDDDPPDEGGTVTLNLNPPLTSIPTVSKDAQQFASYKDSLMGESNGDSMKGDETFEDDDIEILEGDVVRTIVDGMISIQFSERVQSLAEKSFDRTIVLNLLVRRIGYATLKNKVTDLWKPKAGFKLMDIENDYFLASFRSHEDYLTVLADGPWTIFGHYLTVEPWSPEFSPLQPFPHKIVTWIRLPGLPAMLYKRSLIEEIGSCIGSVIEYESLPTVCFSCGKYGHLSDNCPTNATDPTVPVDMVPPNSAQPAESETTEFGPWMLVAKRQRRPARMPQSSSPRHVEKQPLGSRFNLISELREDAMGFGEDHAHRRLSVAMESATIPRQQGRATTDARHQRAIPVRKPLTIVDFSIVSRAAPKAGSSRANLGKISSVVLEKSRHLAVVISENSNPSCPAMEVDHVAPTTSHNSLTRGKSLDSCANLPIGSSMGPLNVVHSDPAATMVPKPVGLIAEIID